MIFIDDIAVYICDHSFSNFLEIYIAIKKNIMNIEI